MSPAGHVITLLLLVTTSLAQEKTVIPEARCGASFSDPFKPVPIQVPENSVCTWTIDRPSSEPTRVIFSNHELNPSANCSQENIKVYNANNALLGVLCPNSPQVAVFESPGVVYIKVSTDSTPLQRTAYFFYYSVTPDNTAVCGGHLKGYLGTISTPNYPNRHPNFAYCVWHLEAPKDTKVRLFFSEIFIEIDPACRFDLIAVYDGPDTNAPLQEVLCGRRVAELETTSNFMTLVFSADYANSYFGFSLDYIAIPTSDNGALSCSSDSMTAILNPDYINSLGYSAPELTLNDPSCTAQSFNPVVFKVPYHGCGTEIKTLDNVIYYTNTIQASPSSGVITRLKDVKFVMTCELDSNSTLEIMYTTSNELIHNKKENGEYDVSLAFYQTQDFINPLLDSPFFIELNDSVFLQASLNTQDPNLSVFVETCFASPTSDFQTPNYDLIRNGCVKDNTYHNIFSGLGYARFSFSAFRFLSANNSVYLQCRVVICEDSENGSRCKQGCITRQRRDLSSKLWNTNAVLGPIRLKQHSESEAAGSISEPKDVVKTDQSTLYVVGISVLVVNVLILALVLMRYYRKEPTNYRYFQVPTQ